MEALVTIAIPDLAGPVALTATLQSLTRHTPETHEVALLMEELRVQHIPQRQNGQMIRQVKVPAPFNTAAGLNRLLATCTTPYILLLESGAIVTSGWLGKLLAPLSDPTVGLSGPSTNSSWNEQQVLPGSGGRGWSVTQIDASAAVVATRYRNQCHPLDTLHSLGDFCYLFKRAVAEQLGGFDEAYGAGPCWEIDFNTRAARAGFRAIWVADAYVHRGPASAWKVASVRYHFTMSKQLYQDRFCGLRLEGKKANYEPHCRGEACEHFAPSDLIQVTLRPGFKDQSLEKPPAYKESNSNAPRATDVEAALVDSTSNSPSRRSGEEGASSTSSRAAILISSASDQPLVSCIMPTHNRRPFIQQALSYFVRQDYQNRELIIVDDGEDRISDLLPPDSRIRYIALPKPTSIGAKRNIACEQAHGDIIAHWDDDDWYAPHRLQYQVAPLLENKADMTGLETSCFFDLTNWQMWACTPELHRRLFVGDVHGGTLVYRRWVWERLARYRPVSLAEDAFFLQQVRQRGARLQKLPHANSFVYIRHDSNAWRFPLGSYLQPAGWKRVDVSTFLPAADLSFYAALSPAAPSLLITLSSSSSSADEEGGGKNHPLVSCIMPTYNRRAYVPQAIQYFLRQDYPNRELLILDDGNESVNDLVPSDPRIRYVPLDKRMILGAKRNLGCKLAQGSIIVHWDDDDWIAPHRISYQVEVLESQQADICGARRLLFYDPVQDKAWLYEYPWSIRHWLAGGTFCYRQAFWAKNPFPEIAVGEDTRFVWSPHVKNAVPVTDHTFYVAIIHSTNTSRKAINGAYWHVHPVNEVRHLLGPDLAFYLSTGKALLST